MSSHWLCRNLEKVSYETPEWGTYPFVFGVNFMPMSHLFFRFCIIFIYHILVDIKLTAEAKWKELSHVYCYAGVVPNLLYLD